mgnify:FL=1
MKDNDLRELERLFYSQWWKVLVTILEEEVERLTNLICHKNTSFEETIILRAERVAIKQLIEQPALTLRSFWKDITEQ